MALKKEKHIVLIPQQELPCQKSITWVHEKFVVHFFRYYPVAIIMYYSVKMFI